MPKELLNFKPAVSPKKLLVKASVSALGSILGHYFLGGSGGAAVGYVVSKPVDHILEHLLIQSGEKATGEVFKTFTEDNINSYLNRQKPKPAHDEMKKGVVLALKNALNNIREILRQEVGQEDGHLDEIFDYWIEQLTNLDPQGGTFTDLFTDKGTNKIDWYASSHATPATQATQSGDQPDFSESDAQWEYFYDCTLVIWLKPEKKNIHYLTLEKDYKKIILKHLPSTFQICFAEMLNNEDNKKIWNDFQKGLLVETRRLLIHIQDEQKQNNRQVSGFLETIERKLADIIAVPALISHFSATVQVALANANKSQEYFLEAIEKQNVILSQIIDFIEKLKTYVHGNFALEGNDVVNARLFAPRTPPSKIIVDDYCKKPLVSREAFNSSFNNCLTKNRKGYFLLSSPSGSGKSAALAKWITQAESNPEYAVLYRFYSNNYETQYFYYGIAEVLDQLINKLGISGGNVPATELDLLRSAFRDMLTVPHAGRLIVILDGLDESDPPLKKGFFPDIEDLADQTYVVFSHRNTEEESTLSECSRRWGIPALEELPGITDFDKQDICALFQSYLQKTSNHSLEKLVSDDVFISDIHRRTRGLAIYVTMLVEELIGKQTSREIVEAAESLPDSFEKYVQSAAKEMRLESFDTELFSLLALSKGPLLDEELAVLLKAGNIKSYLVSLPKGLARWLSISNARYSFQHDSIALAFKRLLLLPHDYLSYQTRFLEFCSDWNNGQPYPLRHYAAHLKDAIQKTKNPVLIKELYALAENNSFLKCQGATLASETDARLNTIKTALDISIENEDIFNIANFCLRHAQQAIDIVLESSLEALRGGNVEKAASLTKLFEDSTIQLLWRLILAADASTRNCSHDVIKQLMWLSQKEIDLAPTFSRCYLVPIIILASKKIEGWDKLAAKLNESDRLGLCRALAQGGHLDQAMTSESLIISSNNRDCARQSLISGYLNKGKYAEANDLLNAIKNPVQRDESRSEISQSLARDGNIEDAYTIASAIDEVHLYERAAAFYSIAVKERQNGIQRTNATFGRADDLIRNLPPDTKPVLLARFALLKVKHTDISDAHDTFGEAIDKLYDLNVTSIKKSDLLCAIAELLCDACLEDESFKIMALNTINTVLDHLNNSRNQTRYSDSMLERAIMALARIREFDESLALAKGMRAERSKIQVLGAIGFSAFQRQQPLDQVFRLVNLDDGLMVASDIARKLVLEGDNSSALEIMSERIIKKAGSKSAEHWGKLRVLSEAASTLIRKGKRPEGICLFENIQARNNHRYSWRRMWGFIDFASAQVRAGETDMGRNTFNDAKQNVNEAAKDSPKRFAEIGAAQGRCQLYEEAKISFKKATLLINEVAQPKFIMYLGEIIDGQIETQLSEFVEEAEVTLAYTLQAIHNMDSAKARAKVAPDLAVELIKRAALKGGVFQDAVNQIIKNFYSVPVTSFSKEEIAKIKRAESVLAAISGDIEGAISNALKISHGGQCSKALQNIALYCVQIRKPAKAVEISEMIQDGRSQLLPNIAEAMVDQKDKKHFLQMVPKTALDLDSAYRSVALLIWLYQPDVGNLEKILSLVNERIPFAK